MVRFLICKRTLAKVPLNDQLWPIPAVGAQASRMTGTDPYGTFSSEGSNVGFRITNRSFGRDYELGRS